MAIFSDPRKYLIEITKELAPDMTEIIMRSLQNQGNQIKYSEIKDMLRTLVISQTLSNAWLKDYTNMINTQLAPYIKQTIQKAEDAVKAQNLAWDFDIAPQAFKLWSQTRAAQLVASITDGQRTGLQNLLQLGANSDAYTVDTMANLIRPVIGLTKRESQAVYNYHSSLIVNEVKPKVALDMATTYSSKLHRARAMRIARTETAYAYNFATGETIRTAQGEGFISSVTKVWSTAMDGRACGLCSNMEGESVGIDDDFETDMGAMDSPPMHPHCRCAVAYEGKQIGSNSSDGETDTNTDEYVDE